jgi:hypothetical protein
MQHFVLFKWFHASCRLQVILTQWIRVLLEKLEVSHPLPVLCFHPVNNIINIYQKLIVQFLSLMDFLDLPNGQI